MRGGYGLFYQTPTYSGNAGGTPLFTAPPFAQGFTNTDSSNNLSSLRKPFPTTTLGYVAADSHVAAFRPRRRSRIRSPAPAAMEPQHPIPAGARTHVRYRLCRFGGPPPDAGARTQSAALASAASPVNCGYDGVAAHCITTNTAQNAALRVPVLGETPTALAANEFSGESAYHSMQVTLRRQAAHGLSFQATYTWSRAASNTAIYNDPGNLALDWAALQLRPHPPRHR